MKKVFLYSFRQSIPVLFSFLPVGIAYGLLMQSAGYNWVWTGLASMFVFAGSLQYLMVSFFIGGTSLIVVALMALLLNSRHIFYGIPFLEKWKNYGPWKFFLIFALPDESFSLHCANICDDSNPRYKKFSYIFVALLNYIYWILSSLLGAFIGDLININTTGLEFAMTALFIVIFMEQILPPDKKTFKKTKSGRGILNTGKLPALFAFVSSILCLIIIGPDSFILPSLAITVVLLFLFKKPIENYMNNQEGEL